MKKYECKPTQESMMDVIQFVEDTVSDANVPAKIAMQVNVAVDEIYSNILHYSRASKASVEISTEANNVMLRFIDDGVPYDPTKIDNPDTTLSADEREIGGLGIFMVKKSMDEMSYEFRDGCNVLTISKSF